jgi:hypothetical protein
MLALPLSVTVPRRSCRILPTAGTKEKEGLVQTRSTGWLAWVLWVLTLLALAVAAWLDQLLRLADRPALTWSQAGGVPFGVTAISAATVGAVVASRRPSHPVGWLLLGLGLSLEVQGVVQGYVRYGLVGRPGALPAAGYLIGLSHGTLILWLSCAIFVLLLTPTGRLPSPRWRWWARLAAVAAVLYLLGSVVDSQPLSSQYPTIWNPLAIPALAGPLAAVLSVAFLVICAAVLVAAGSLVIRFRRARGIERQQLRWVALAAGLAPLAVLGIAAGLAVGSWIVVGWAVGLYLAMPVLATGAAILRYRLYDIDRIISRTLAYGLLTVLLAGAYAGVVLGLGQLLGRESSLVVAAATLAVAALFQPARRRIQALVDRRFNRRKYDAANTVETFSTHLRDEVDLDALSAELLAVVDQTMQPTTASLWLSPLVQAAPATKGPSVGTS